MDFKTEKLSKEINDAAKNGAIKCVIPERPILFRGEMVRAILDGSKTQTRRIVKMVKQNNCITIRKPTHKRTGSEIHVLDVPKCPKLCRYGVPGDRLWVRETFLVQPELWANSHGPQPVHYAAGQNRNEVEDYVGKPSIHMPRWASRIDLEVVGVRVESLQDISEEDAVAEGCGSSGPAPVVAMGRGARLRYCFLWDEINGAGSWDANPWVMVIKFKRIRP